jgi:hypothetical protein
MIDEQELRQRMQRIAELVNRLDSEGDSNASKQAKELLESVMDLHGEAIDRIIGRLRNSGPSGEEAIQSLAVDPVVSNVLILYNLHPHDLETRVGQAVDKVQSEIRGFGCGLEIQAVDAGHVRLRVTGAQNSVTARSVRQVIEDAIYSSAPDTASLVLLGLESFASPDFVPLEKVGLAKAGA